MKMRQRRALLNTDGRVDTDSRSGNSDSSRLALSFSYNWQHSLIKFYVFHQAFVLGVLVLGIIKNGGDKKYIPVDAKGMGMLLVTYKEIDSSTKSIDVREEALLELGMCDKAFANAHSKSVNEVFSAVCCTKRRSTRKKNTTTLSFDMSNLFRNEEIHYQSNLCHPPLPIFGVDVHRLPFAKRLTRFPEAWILPLLPILIRIMFQFLLHMSKVLCFNWKYVKKIFKPASTKGHCHCRREGSMLSSSEASSSSVSLDNIIISRSEFVPSENLSRTTRLVQTPQLASPNQQTLISPHQSLRKSLQRLLFYLFILNFRGWGLYIGANALEDYFLLPWLTGNSVISPIRTDSMSDEEHDLHLREDSFNASFGKLVKKDLRENCWYKDLLKPHHQKAMENDVHAACYGRAFDFSDHVVLFLAHYLPVLVMETLFCVVCPFWGSNQSTSKQVMWYSFHLSLFVYLHLIILHSTYQTAAYFHTVSEILVGYGVSLILQLPLAYIMCFDSWGKVRKFVGLPNGEHGGMNVEFTAEKGD